MRKIRCIVSVGDANMSPSCYEEVISATFSKKEWKVAASKISKILLGGKNVNVFYKSAKEIQEIRKIKQDLYQYNQQVLGFSEEDAKRLAELMTSGF